MKHIHIKIVVLFACITTVITDAKTRILLTAALTEPYNSKSYASDIVSYANNIIRYVNYNTLHHFSI